MSYESRISAVVLSRGSQWNPLPQSPPYLLADPLNPWPEGANAEAVFYTSKGVTIATIDSGIVQPDAIYFQADPDVVDNIPAGSKFEIFIDTGLARSQIRYGEVMRREAQFLDAPGLTTTYEALKFVDTFPTLGLRSTWERVAGTTKVFDNSAASLPNGVGVPNTLSISPVRSAIRWYTPLNSDTVSINVSLLNQHANPLDGSATRIILCADQRFTQYLAVEFLTSIPTNTVRLCTGAGNYKTVTYRGPTINNTVADGDNYTITYNDTTKQLAVYKGASSTPMGTPWTDSGLIVPHGPGFRYAGLVWDNGGGTDGIQVSYWSAKDDL